jgi:hypothetical protein
MVEISVFLTGSPTVRGQSGPRIRALAHQMNYGRRARNPEPPKTFGNESYDHIDAAAHASPCFCLEKISSMKSIGPPLDLCFSRCIQPRGSPGRKMPATFLNALDVCSPGKPSTLTNIPGNVLSQRCRSSVRANKDGSVGLVVV